MEWNLIKTNSLFCPTCGNNYLWFLLDKSKCENCNWEGENIYLINKKEVRKKKLNKMKRYLIEEKIKKNGWKLKYK